MTVLIPVHGHTRLHIHLYTTLRRRLFLARLRLHHRPPSTSTWPWRTRSDCHQAAECNVSTQTQVWSDGEDGPRKQSQDFRQNHKMQLCAYVLYNMYICRFLHRYIYIYIDVNMVVWIPIQCLDRVYVHIYKYICFVMSPIVGSGECMRRRTCRAIYIYIYRYEHIYVYMYIQ